MIPAHAGPTKDPRAERTEPKPARLQGIDVKERLDSKLPLNLSFTDSSGKQVRLGDYFARDVPVVVTLNYSNCPMLCSLQLNGFVEGLKQLEWTAGEQFEIVTVSIDPEETPKSAAQTKARYLRQYRRNEAARGWHFLSGAQEPAHVKALANAIGFQYGFNEARDEYVHPAAMVIATPDGRIARYLYGIEYHPKTLRLSLVESSEGKIGSTMDQLILYCFHYDSSEGRYAPVARNIMRVGGGLGALALGSFLAVLWRAEKRKQRLTERTAQP